MKRICEMSNAEFLEMFCTLKVEINNRRVDLLEMLENNTYSFLLQADTTGTIREIKKRLATHKCEMTTEEYTAFTLLLRL